MPTYLISGARTGMGLEYVKQLAVNSHNTIVALVRDVSGDLKALIDVQSSADAKVIIVECDISSPGSISSVTARLSTGLKIDFLIQNAAILLPSSAQETSLTISAESLQAHFSTNVVGPALLLQALSSHLAPGAVVANIASGLGSMTMLADSSLPAQLPAYSISKSALNMLTLQQASQLRGKATVICLDPGHVKTSMGGAEAVLEICDSVKQLLQTIAALKTEDHGKFLRFDGTVVPF